MDITRKAHLHRITKTLSVSSDGAARILFSEEIVNFLVVRILKIPFHVTPYALYRRMPYRAFNNAMQSAVDYVDKTKYWYLQEMLILMSMEEINLNTFWMFNEALCIHYFSAGIKSTKFIDYCIHLVYVAVLFYIRGVRYVISFTARTIEAMVGDVESWGALNKVAEKYAALNPAYVPNSEAVELAEITYRIHLLTILKHIYRQRRIQLRRFYQLSAIRQARGIYRTTRTRLNAYRGTLLRPLPTLLSLLDSFESSTFNELNSSNVINEPSCSKEINKPFCIKEESETEDEKVLTSSAIEHEPPSRRSEPPPKRLKCSSAEDKLELGEQNSSNDDKMSTDIEGDAHDSTTEPTDLQLER